MRHPSWLCYDKEGKSEEWLILSLFFLFIFFLCVFFFGDPVDSSDWSAGGGGRAEAAAPWSAVISVY